jgi:hypothetical protein
MHMQLGVRICNNCLEQHSSLKGKQKIETTNDVTNKIDRNDVPIVHTGHNKFVLCSTLLHFLFQN